jgi:hypothetical protein
MRRLTNDGILLWYACTGGTEHTRAVNRTQLSLQKPSICQWQSTTRLGDCTTAAEQSPMLERRRTHDCVSSTSMHTCAGAKLMHERTQTFPTSSITDSTNSSMRLAASCPDTRGTCTLHRAVLIARRSARGGLQLLAGPLVCLPVLHLQADGSSTDEHCGIAKY